MSAVVNFEHTPQSEATALIQAIERAAVNPAVDVEKMERLMQMHERIIARDSKAAYSSALADMQPELPIISERGGIKDRNGNVQSKYALWEDVVGVITPILSKHGFALSFRTGNDANGVTVTGVLSHRFGHSEQTSLTLPIDTSGSKNAVQSVGSSTSYGKRYTCAALLNLRTGDVDNDGADIVPEGPVDYQDWKADMTALADEGIARLESGWKKSAADLRKHATTHDGQWWAKTKTRAQAVQS